VGRHGLRPRDDNTLCHCEEQRDAAIHRVSSDAHGGCGSVSEDQWIATGCALAMTRWWAKGTIRDSIPCPVALFPLQSSLFKITLHPSIHRLSDGRIRDSLPFDIRLSLGRMIVHAKSKKMARHRLGGCGPLSLPNLLGSLSRLSSPLSWTD